MTDLQNLTFGNNTPVSQRRLGELLLYISSKTANIEDYGSTKINKTLYYADFENFKNTGASITGVQYQRLERGPAPKHILYVERALQNDGALSIDKTTMVHKRIAQREADLSLFTQEEIALIDRYIDELSNLTSTAVSEDSHDVKWRVVNNTDLLPYEFAFLDEKISEKDKVDTKDLAIEFGW